jgi:serine protease Do
VSSIGYPLQDLLAETPNLTRGNISAEGGMKGSLGLFQFSAPIQPGASGGPIISDSGQVLGASVSTLNSPALARDGIVPQNVNFGLAAKHIVKFLTKEKIEFSESDDVKNPDLQQINKNALAATVRIACYQ